jgi:hypothetical protein
MTATTKSYYYVPTEDGTELEALHHTCIAAYARKHDLDVEHAGDATEDDVCAYCGRGDR